MTIVSSIVGKRSPICSELQHGSAYDVRGAGLQGALQKALGQAVREHHRELHDLQQRYHQLHEPAL